MCQASCQRRHLQPKRALDRRDQADVAIESGVGRVGCRSKVVLIRTPVPVDAERFACRPLRPRLRAGSPEPTRSTSRCAQAAHRSRPSLHGQRDGGPDVPFGGSDEGPHETRDGSDRIDIEPLALRRRLEQQDRTRDASAIRQAAVDLWVCTVARGDGVRRAVLRAQAAIFCKGLDGRD
jgi:hypothetical protein